MPPAASSPSIGVRPGRRLLRPAAVVLALAIFLVDVLTPLEGAVAVLYVVVVLIAARTGRRGDILVAAGAGLAGTVLAYLLSHGLVQVGSPSLRALVSLAAIAITAALALGSRAAHAALVQSERRYRRMFEGSRVGILEEDWTAVRVELDRLGIAGADGLAAAISADPSLVTRARRGARIVGLNPAFRAMIGVADGAGASVDDILGDDDKSFVPALAAFLRGERFFEGETELARGDGTRLPVMFGIDFPAPGERDGDVFVFVVDLSERRAAQDALLAAQAELAHAARIATLGELSASIAHEVNQPLMAVVTNGEAALRWLRRPEPDLGEVEAGLGRIVAEGRRASSIVTGIRGFLGKAEPGRVPLAPAELVEDALRLVAHEISRAGVRVGVSVATNLPAVAGDRVALQQVLVNLALNAVQAMATIGAPRHLTVTAGRVPEGVAFAVADSGPGLSGTDPERLFAPFFTTRSGGMGMGLAISRTTAEAHGGRLTAADAPGGGAEFRLVLPAAAGGSA